MHSTGRSGWDGIRVPQRSCALQRGQVTQPRIAEGGNSRLRGLQSFICCPAELGSPGGLLRRLLHPGDAGGQPSPARPSWGGGPRPGLPHRGPGALSQGEAGCPRPARAPSHVGAADLPARGAQCAGAAPPRPPPSPRLGRWPLIGAGAVVSANGRSAAGRRLAGPADQGGEAARCELDLWRPRGRGRAPQRRLQRGRPDLARPWVCGAVARPREPRQRRSQPAGARENRPLGLGATHPESRDGKAEAGLGYTSRLPEKERGKSVCPGVQSLVRRRPPAVPAPERWRQED